MNKELVVIENLDMVSFFTKSDNMDKILAKIRETALSEIRSVETLSSRKAIASTAYKVSQSKTMLDNAGKKLVSDWKAEIKKIDDSRRHVRDYLDNLKNEVRQPLTEWEIAEKEREEKKRADAAFEKAWDEAHAEHELFLKQKAIEKKEAEFARQQAKKQAEEDRQKEIEEQKKHDERIRQEAELQAQRKIAEREKQLEIEKEEAERNRIIAEERAKIDKEIAVQEMKRKTEEAENRKREKEQAEIARLKAIEEKKAADINHQKKINNIILKGLIKEGLTEEQGKKIISAIFFGRIKHVTINY